MRGENQSTQSMFCYVSPETMVPKDHPLRPLKVMVDAALKEISVHFDAIYSHTGRPSIPPEKLLKASLLQAFFTIRSERQLVEQIGYNLLFRWFLDMALDEKPWDATVFSKNRDRLLKAEISAHFFAAVLAQARREQLLSSEHFTVDGTLLEAWASIKSFRPKDGPPEGPVGRNEERDFKGQKLSNATHASVTDPEAKLYRKSSQQGADLYYMGHTLMENRNGLVVEATVTQANGTAEREAALAMVKKVVQKKGKKQRITLGADKGYDTQGFVDELQKMQVTPHVAQNNTNRASAIDGRTTRHPGYAVSLRIRKRVEEIFGWMKTVGNYRSPKYRGIDRVGWHFTLVAAAYNLVRMRNILALSPT
jgi:transposase